MIRRMKSTDRKKRIVMLGAGFGGLAFCRAVDTSRAEVVLIDRQNHHTFQPLLYQVATAGLSVPDIAHPIRSIFRRKGGVDVRLDEALHVDTAKKEVRLRDTGSIDYDYLVIGVGARTNYFGNDRWEAFAPGLKTLDDAALIRQRILYAFEQADLTDDAEERARLMTIVVVGGGPTGVELAGAFAELSRFVLRKDFHHIDPAQTRIILIEATERILRPFTPGLAAKAHSQLEKLGVEIRLNARIQAIDEHGLTLEDGLIPAANVVWGAGVRASRLCASLPVERDRAGRVKVAPDLSLPGHPEVFAVGDIVHLVDAAGKPVPGVSPAAMQMGRHVARILNRELRGKSGARPPFRYLDKGSMATIGRSKAVADIRGLRFSGFPAWMAWLVVHLIFLVGFRNRLSVLLSWIYNYFAYRGGARIITGLDRMFRLGNPEARPRSIAEGTPGAAAEPAVNKVERAEQEMAASGVPR